MQSYLLEFAFAVCKLLLPCQHCSVDTATKTNRYLGREQKMRKQGIVCLRTLRSVRER